MTFNTMCDLCSRKGFLPFATRKKHIAELVAKSDPDILALQEVRHVGQINELLVNNHPYEVISLLELGIGHADPVLLYKSAKFSMEEMGAFWLGPSTGFNLGWKIALPRKTVWAVLIHKQTEQKILVITAHFDNRLENIAGSAEKITNFVRSKNLPTIFLADTNTTPDMPAYNILMQEMNDSFASNLFSETSVDNCYLRKGKVFPACRVDHILTSKKHPWSSKTWTVDTTRFDPLGSFPSDHRPVTATLSL